MVTLVKSSDSKVLLKPHTIMTALILGAVANGAVGCLLALIGAVTPKWVVTSHNVSAGVIFACREDVCKVFGAEGYIAASKVFVVLAFFCAVAGLIDNVVYYFLFFRREASHRELICIGALFYFFAVALDTTGVVIFAVKGKADVAAALKYPVDLAYSFDLTIAAIVFCGVAGAMSLLHSCRLPKPPKMSEGIV